MAGPGTRLAPPSDEQIPERWRGLLLGSVAPVAELEAGEAAAGGEAAAPSGRPLNILRTIAHHPRLLEPFLAFAATLATAGSLSRRHSELLALRAAWNCRSDFEWGHHVVYARAAGLSEEEIARLSQGADADGWSPEERLLVRTADALHREQDCPDALYESLREHFDAAQLVEIPFVVGQYTMLSMVAKLTGVPLEPGLPTLPAG